MAQSATAFPVQKVTAGAIAGAVTTLIAASIPGFKPEPEIMGAITLLLTLAASYFTPPAAGEIVEAKPEKPGDVPPAAAPDREHNTAAALPVVQATIVLSQPAAREVQIVLSEQLDTGATTRSRQTSLVARTSPLAYPRCGDARDSRDGRQRNGKVHARSPR
jgi:hypothetical protein